MANNVGERYGHSTIIKELGKGKILIRCDCGFEKEVYKSNFMRGSQQSCGRKECPYHKSGRKVGSVTNDLTHKRFGQLEVIEELGHDKVLVKCDCGVQKVMWKASLTKGQAVSCGHLGKMYPGQKLDLLNKTFDSLTVIAPTSNGNVLVRCECGKEFEVSRRSLMDGTVKSCGCKHREYLMKTSIERYGDVGRRASNPREAWQVETVNNPVKLVQAINTLTSKLGHKPTIDDLCKLLNTQKATILLRIKNAGANDLVEFYPYVSAPEKEVFQYVESILPGVKVEHSVRKFKDVGEIDIFLPDKKIGIEFNGVYWHCSLNKDKKYHQNKSIACLKHGIRLIHIYEYEWKIPAMQMKIKQYLNDILLDKSQVLYARNLHIEKLSKDEEKAFLESNHLQGYTNSEVCYGLYTNNTHNTKELVSLMSFGKPRFNQDAEWELIRYCNKAGVAIVGGAERLFNAFIKEHNPSTVQSYAALDKFTGEVYSRLGFRISTSLTEPGYLWVEDNTFNTLTRYQTMKKNLVEKGLGTSDQTEDEIMYNLGYYKVYNSGNLIYIWSADKQN